MGSRGTDLRQVQGDYRSLDDRMLVLDFQTGHPEAFVEIHRRYRGVARGVCGRILLNDQDAEEALQETMIRVFQGLHRFNGQYALSPWIARIATNISIDALRARDRRPAIDGGSPDDLDSHDPADDPAKAVERLLERDLVISVLSDLPESHRTALVLRELEGRSHKEIGQTLGITSAQAKALIHRAKGSFRRGWLHAITERGGVAGIALLPLVWAMKAFEGGRRVMDKVVGHAGQVAQATTPDIVSSAVASPVVTTAVSVGDRVVATGMAVLLAGGVTVGAVTVAKRNASENHRAAQAAVVPAVEEPQTTIVVPIVEDRALEQLQHSGQGQPADEPLEEVDPVPAVPSDGGTAEEPTPTPEPTPEPSPSESPLPPAPPPAPAWSYDFVTSTESVESCACDGSSTASSSRIERLAEGAFGFSQVIQGGARDASGDQTWPFSLQQWGEVGPSAGRVDYRFRLTSAAGVFLYYGSGSLAETTQNEDGSTMYRFEGTYDLLSSQAVAPGLPSRGFGSLTIGVWQDGTIYTGSFALQDAQS